VLFIRGFKSSNDSFIDGARDSGVTIHENFMTEQVEIPKRPSSAIGGRGVTGGAVTLVTKTPQKEIFVGVGLTTETANKKRTRVDASRAVTEDFRVRFNAMWQDANVAGRDNVYDDRWGAGIALKFTPTDALTFNLNYYHLVIDQMPDWGVPWDRVAGR
jgi:catecholate siderophore receptor